MINPDLMNQQLENDGREPNRYQRREEIEPISEVPFTMSYDEQAEEAYEQPPMRQYENPKHQQEEELAPGLYQSDIDSWKKQFGEVWLAQIKGQPFVYRSLERFEYKQIVATPNADPLMREEMICEHCVLYPQDYNFSVIANKKAGTPAVLSELIMENSDFTRDVVVTKL